MRNGSGNTRLREHAIRYPDPSDFSTASAAASLGRGGGRELLTLQRPARVLTEPTVLAHEPLGTLCIAPKLPIEPAHRDRRGGAAIRFEEGAAVPDGKIGHRNRHVRDPLEVIHAVWIRDVGWSTQDIDHGCMQRLEDVLADVHARNCD